MMSQQLLGKEIEAVYHTGIVVHEVFEYAVKRHASRPALGERDVEETT